MKDDIILCNLVNRCNLVQNKVYKVYRMIKKLHWNSKN
jgi:hypothetical protein